MAIFRVLTTNRQRFGTTASSRRAATGGGPRANRYDFVAPDPVAGAVPETTPKARHLVTSGDEGTATITAVRETGTVVGDDLGVELDLQVKVGAAPPYPVTHRQAISRSAVADFAPGARVAVKVDPWDPESLTII